MKHLAAGLLLFCWLPLWGQVTNLHFTNLSIDAGLSDKMVFAVAQDSTGLMWFGTAEGLNRYDGYNFETFPTTPGIRRRSAPRSSTAYTSHARANCGSAPRRGSTSTTP